MNITHRQVQSELRKYVRVNTKRGALLFIMEITIYLTFICGVLFLPFLWMKVFASVLAGIKMANLATIAHDASHNSLTGSRNLNKCIAVTAFLPCLFNYRLWIYDHHTLHHTRTNEDFPDSYTPFSKAEYDTLPKVRRQLEKLYRKPSVLFFGLYYILQRWRKVKLYPRKDVPKDIHTSAWCHFAIIACFLTAFLALLLFAPTYSNTGSATAIMLGFMLPFYIFQSLFAFTVYVQHTHEKVAWFKTPPDREGDGRQEFITVNLVFPDWLRLLMHDVYTHPAHHVCPAIPCYELRNAQEHLSRLLGDQGVTQQFSFSWLFRTMRICQLYDFQNHLWLDFDGNPTSEPTITNRKIEYANAA